MNGNTVAKTGGGLAFATGLVVFFTHGLAFTDVERGLMAAAGGVAITYVVNLLEYLAVGKKMSFIEPVPPPRDVDPLAGRL